MSGVPFEQRLVFSHTVEGLFAQAMKGRVTDRLKARLKSEAQLDLDKKIEPAIPLTRWNRCVELCAEELFGELPLEAALQKIGYLHTRGYFETFIGRALSGVLKVIGPARALARMDRSFRSGNNYSEAKVTELAPRHFRFWCNDLGLARFVVLGVLSAGAEVAGAKNLKSEVTHFDDQGCTIELKWDA